MKEKLLLFTLLLFLCCNSVLAQEISLDTSGRLYNLKLLRAKDDIAVTINSELSADIMQARIKTFFLEKVSTTLVNLDDPNQLYAKYYDRLWSPAPSKRLSEIKSDLVHIKKWLEDSTAVPALHHLQPFYDNLKVLRALTNPKDWFTVNGDPLADSVTVNKKGTDKNTGAYVITLRQNNLFNKFITTLYQKTYLPASNSGMNGLSVNDYLVQEKALKTLLERIEKILKKDLNDMEAADSTEMEDLQVAVDGNRIITAMRSNSAYFSNWIWLRTGELTINPFEMKGKDTLKSIPAKAPLPRSRNISLLKQSTTEDEFLNRILLSHNIKREQRNIHFFRLEGATLKQNKEALDEPLRGDERVRVNVHNVRANERLEVVLTDTVRHNGLNETMNSIESGISLLASAYKQFSGLSSFIGTSLVPGTTLKALKGRGNYKRIDAMNDSVTMLRTILDSLTLDLTDKKRFNPYFFQRALENPVIFAMIRTDRILPNTLDAFLETFLDKYGIIYDNYALLKETIANDSLLVAITYNNIYESSAPPAAVPLQKGPDQPVYRTEILETDKLNDDLRAKYLIMSFATNGHKTDTLKLASFTTKNAKLKWMTASAGIMFTFPDRSYAMNTFTGGGNAAAIVSKQKNTSFVVGLNIYAKPINMLDNHWFGSKNCPVYSRISLFIGLDVPDVLNHFYPGLSYDIVPGLKVTGGAHLYRHTNYEVRNNVAIKGDVLRGAGPFVGLSIDPAIAVKAINIFK